MTSLSPQFAAPAAPPTVTLTRADVEAIVVRDMGWEPEDVAAFWFLASMYKRPGGQP
jgi:hypothetical protein